MNRILAVCGAAAVLAMASAAAADDKGHEGIYGRIDVGANYMTTSPSEGDSSTSGIGTQIGITAGHSVMKNLILHGEFNYSMALSPEISGGGKTASPDGLSLNFLSVGPGATYFLDNGISFSGAALFASVSSKMDNVPEQDAATGFGLRLGAGKDIWLSEQFALNAGADFFWATISAGEGKAKVDGSAMSFGLRIGGSFN